MNANERRFQDIYDIGCIACRKRWIFGSQCQIHHLNLNGKAGQKRRGDRYTIGLCPWHHMALVVVCEGETVSKLESIFGPSLALKSKAFRAEFASDDELLAYQDELIENRRRLAV